MNKLQLTLAIFKPDISLNERAVSEIRKIILKDNYLFVRTKFHKMTLEKAKEFYKVHEKKFFYNRLVYSMSSGPIWCHILARENAIKEWRKLMGPTKVFKTIYDEPQSLRGNYGVTDTRNTLHGSDSDENARTEIDFFFEDFDINKWYANEEKLFRDPKNLMFDEKCVEHKIK
ncbi:nucleoside diphosphate kinase 6-like [Brachionus plicatilis]|uniref:Nucleoside diphosphate kinase 6-like n=1 Tax=Brachionus plicatilis TaxID=10195 RepID=A0A3M7S4I5_BRAPC|nr:nucleoside diphosphate kinase 6-like [Brachionus plicatilis]RNA30716.1 nucleoside diphosphate kinase 6-like [Brachionus plicatilis]